MDDLSVKISVVGVGGAGCNAISRLTQLGIRSAETIALNTDRLHLKIVNAHKKHVLGEKITRGLGAGGFPEVARRAAESDRERIRELLSGSELVFISAGMGGGTGTGAAPVVAEVAKDLGATVVGVVTYPFKLERIRQKTAVWGIQELLRFIDTLVVIDNNRLIDMVPNLPMDKAFALADEIIARAVGGISDTIKFDSLINIDFADVRTVMTNGGLAVISLAEASGPSKVMAVSEKAVSNPLLDADVRGGKSALIHIAGGDAMTIKDVTEIGERIGQHLREDAEVIWGARVDPTLKDTYIVTSIVTGVKSRLVKVSDEVEAPPAPMKEREKIGVESINF